MLRKIAVVVAFVAFMAPTLASAKGPVVDGSAPVVKVIPKK